ncbi:MAG: DUF4292 domain-containing protein [Taibaiella sp.]|jgi:hypothetical protein
MISRSNPFKNIRTTCSKLGIALCAVALIISAEACKTTKKAVTTEPVKPAGETLKPEDYLSRVIVWNSFNGKADMHFENKDQNQDFNGNLRLRKDKDIWASVIALGIAEVARAYITPDSLKAIVRIGKKAYALSYKEGLELIQAQVEFPVLQNLFIGNPLISNVPVKKWDQKDSFVLITQVKDDFTQELTYNKRTGTLTDLQLSSAQRNFKCTIRYEQYGPITNQQPFAFNRYIVINNKGEEIKLNMEFNKAELDVPVEISFSIPDSYERMSIPKK